MTSETPVGNNVVTKGLIDLGLTLPDEREPKWPTSLAELLTQDPKKDTFPFFQRIEKTEPGKAFLVWGVIRKSSDQAILGEDTDLKDLPGQFLSSEFRAQRKPVLAIVVVKDRRKGILKPTKDELLALRNINRSGRMPENAVLVLTGIRTLYSQSKDLELFLVKETRGRKREIETREIEEAEDLVTLQADPDKVVGKLRDRFHNLWQFGFVNGARLTPFQAKDNIEKFLKIAA